MKSLVTIFLLLASAGTAAAQESPGTTDTTAAQEPGATGADADAAGRAESQPSGAAVAEREPQALSLERLKLSGYIQSRYVWAEDSEAGVDESGSPTVKDGFTVRRARLKTTYELDWGRFVLQLDATSRGVALKDAEAQLHVPYTDKALTIVMGQTKWPFGFEVPQSSSEREFPERSRVVRAFLPGERDRGAKLVGKLGPMRLAAGVFDGNGIDHEGFDGVDNDRSKDLVGRLGVDLGTLTAGISGWYGSTLRVATADVSEREFDRVRLGADAQLELELVPLGATQLRAEYIQGTTPVRKGVEQYGQDAHGYYVTLVQALGERGGIAVRYDWLDLDRDADDAPSSSDPTRPASANAASTTAAGVFVYFGKAIKASLFYEHNATAVAAAAGDPDDDGLVFQLQAKY